MHYCTSYCADKSRRTHGRTDAMTHGHTPNKNCNNYISLTRKRARQNDSSQIFTKIDKVKENSMSDLMALVRNGDLLAYYIYFAVSITHSIANCSPSLARRHDPLLCRPLLLCSIFDRNIYYLWFLPGI